jgi:formate-dependent phosphoribosylglycinamide formyltransferase (GAR transformylase)
VRSVLAVTVISLGGAGIFGVEAMHLMHRHEGGSA